MKWLRLEELKEVGAYVCCVGDPFEVPQVRLIVFCRDDLNQLHLMDKSLVYYKWFFGPLPQLPAEHIQ